MQNAIWNAQLRLLRYCDKGESSLEVYLSSYHEFDVIDEDVKTWLKVYLCRCPVPILEEFRGLVTPRTNVHFITQQKDLDELLDQKAHARVDIWLVEGDVKYFIDTITRNLSYFVDKRIEVYILHERAVEIMQAQLKVVKSCQNSSLWEVLTPLPASEEDALAISELLLDTGLPTSHQMGVLHGLGSTIDLPELLDLRELIRSKSSVLLRNDFWEIRNRARELYQQYGENGCRMHPEYQNCVNAELCVSASLKVMIPSGGGVLEEDPPSPGGRQQLDAGFAESIETHLTFVLEHPKAAPAPKLLIYNEPLSTRTINIGTWIEDYIVPAVGASFLCVLHLTDVFDMYVGGSEANLRNSLAVAEKMTDHYEWVVLVLTDLELLRRDDDHDAADQLVERNLVTSLLVHLDGIQKRNDRLAVIGLSRSRVSDLDEALIRPGRFSSHIPARII